jgi:hypothetical protein
MFALNYGEISTEKCMALCSCHKRAAPPILGVSSIEFCQCTCDESYIREGLDRIKGFVISPFKASEIHFYSTFHSLDD